MGATVGFRDTVPELLATVCATVAGKPRHYLSGAAAKRNPFMPFRVNPAGVGLALDKRPQFVQLQHIIRLGGCQRGVQWRQTTGFFLTRPTRFGGRPRKCVQGHAGWSVRGTPARFRFSAQGCSRNRGPVCRNNHRRGSGIFVSPLWFFRYGSGDHFRSGCKYGFLLS